MALALSWRGWAMLALLATSAAAAALALAAGGSQSVPGLVGQAALAAVVFVASLLKRGGGRLIGARIVLGLIAGVKALELLRAALA